MASTTRASPAPSNIAGSPPPSSNSAGAFAFNHQTHHRGHVHALLTGLVGRLNWIAVFSAAAGPARCVLHETVIAACAGSSLHFAWPATDAATVHPGALPNMLKESRFIHAWRIPLGPKRATRRGQGASVAPGSAMVRLTWRRRRIAIRGLDAGSNTQGGLVSAPEANPA